MGLDLNNINKKFRKFIKGILKFRWAILIIFLVLIIYSILGLQGLQFDSSDDAWYFEDDPIVVTENKFEDIFGDSEIVAVHLQHKNIMQKEILKKVRYLSEEIENKLPYVDQVTSITNMEYIKGTQYGIKIGELIPEKIPENKDSLQQLHQEALERNYIKNRLISEDGTETFIIANLKSMPDEWRQATSYITYLRDKSQKYPQVYSAINLSEDVSPNQVIGSVILNIVGKSQYEMLDPQATGMYVQDYKQHKFYQKESPRLIILGLIISVIILAISLRSVRGVIFPVLTAIGGMVITLGIEGHLNLIVQPSVVPIPLFLGLAISVGYSIHIFNFYKQKLEATGKRKLSVMYAVEKAGWPLLFTALTTMCALTSFLLIDVKILNWVGITTTIIVALTYILTVVIFPIFLSFGKNKKVSQKNEWSNGFLGEKLATLSEFTMQNPIKLLLAYSLIAIVAVFGLFRAEVNFSMEKTMGRKVEFVDDILQISDTQIGSVWNYSVCLEFDQQGIAKEPETLHKLNKFVQHIESYPLTKRTTSVLDRIKEINKVLHSDKEEYYKVPETRQMIAQSLLLYENAGGDRIDNWVNYSYDKLRIRVELEEFKQEELLDNHKEIKKIGQEYFPNAKISTMGSIARYADMSHKVAWGQVKAFAYSIAIIACLMMIVFGSFKVGLIAIIPNISPALVVGGIMGYFDIPLDMIMSTVMPMLLGLAVDDTIHFINHVKYEFQKRGDYNLAVKNSFRSVGKALVMTSAVIIFNFSAYTTSVAKIYIHFGILASAGILAALLSDLFITPICIKMSNAFGEENQ